MAFTRWSQLNPPSKITLKPDLGIRSWNEVEKQEKERIWLHYRQAEWFSIDVMLHDIVMHFSNDHKARGFCNNLLGHNGPHYSNFGGYHVLEDCCKQAAHRDFLHIFTTEHQDVAYELISYYAERLGEDYGRFMNLFNDISNQFGLNALLTNSGFILRQEPKITTDVYEPTLQLLADEKWKAVGRELDDAFDDYLKGTPESYSSSVTHAVAGVQAFLQILVKGKTGSGDTADLLKEGQQKNLIPNDQLSSKVLKDMVSLLMNERQTKGDPHPKSQYGDEKTARLVLNITMVFVQHCLQK